MTGRVEGVKVCTGIANGTDEEASRLRHLLFGCLGCLYV